MRTARRRPAGCAEQFHCSGDEASAGRCDPILITQTGWWDGLLGYGKACVDVLYRNYIGHELPITTISLIQGECLGGGFEAALSSDVLVAERQARFGFPEIMFKH